MSKFEKGILIPYIIGIGLLIFCMCGLTGCEAEPTPPISTVDIEYSEFDLVIDNRTNIVYIDNEVCSIINGFKHYYHIYTPYYSGNGRICTYKDGKVVEIE